MLALRELLVRRGHARELVGERMTADAVIWHDLECGAYTADLPFWIELARDVRGSVLDIGAGTGRVALALARAGRAVIALERDASLARELRRRARGLAVEVIVADACDFDLAAPVALAVVPMQTIHLLEDRPAFLGCARRALAPGAPRGRAAGRGRRALRARARCRRRRARRRALRERADGAAP